MSKNKTPKTLSQDQSPDTTIPSYNPQIENDHTEEKNSIQKSFESMQDNNKDTLGMISTQFKEFRQNFTKEELEKDDKKVMIQRQDKFIEATDKYDEAYRSVTVSLSKMIDSFDSKNEEQDTALKSTIESTQSVLNNSLKDMTSKLDEAKKELDNKIKEVTDNINNLTSDLTEIIPTGAIMYFANNNDSQLSKNWLKCDGTTIYGPNYRKLYDTLYELGFSSANRYTIPNYYSNIHPIFNYHGIGNISTSILMNWSDYIKFYRTNGNYLFKNESHLRNFLDANMTCYYKMGVDHWNIHLNTDNQYFTLWVDGNTFFKANSTGCVAWVEIIDLRTMEIEGRYWVAVRDTNNTYTEYDSSIKSKFPSAKIPVGRKADNKLEYNGVNTNVAGNDPSDVKHNYLFKVWVCDDDKNFSPNENFKLPDLTKHTEFFGRYNSIADVTNLKIDLSTIAKMDTKEPGKSIVSQKGMTTNFVSYIPYIKHT